MYWQNYSFSHGKRVFRAKKKQGYFDIKPGENNITDKDTHINNFGDPEYYLPNNGFEVTGFKNI